MPKKLHQASLFSQKLDRAVMTSYFLGAVVPLLALSICVERYVIDQLRSDYATLQVVVGVLSIALLSLASFFALRRVTANSLEQIQADNTRLAQLLEASESLSQATHAEQVVGATLILAAGMVRTDDAVVLSLGKYAESFEIQRATSDDAERRYRQVEESLAEALETAAETGRVTLFTAAPDASAESRSALVAPLEPGASSHDVIVVLRREPDGFRSAEVDSLTTLVRLASVSLRSCDLQEAQRNFFTHVTELLCVALDSHLDRLTGHGQRVAHYSNRIGRRLELREDELQRLHFACLLHDVGMLRIERAKHRSQSACRDHAAIGGKMLSRIRLWEHLAPIVTHHHERFDGTGYPDQLAGEDIPLLCRILTVADAFDAMTSRTSYRDAMPLPDAVSQLRENAGSQFDPEIVGVFVDLVDAGEIP